LRRFKHSRRVTPTQAISAMLTNWCRCRKRAPTQAMRADDPRLLGIPRSRLIIAIIYPHHDVLSQIPRTSRPRLFHKVLSEHISVARVRPRTSKGITDLLLPRTSIGYAPRVPLRRIQKEITHVIQPYLASRGLVR